MRLFHVSTLPSLLAAAVLAGCGNPCEKLCDNLADYADECGFSVPDAEVDECRAAQEAATPEDKDTCEDYGTPEAVRAEWTCEDLEIYWDGDAGGGGTPTSGST